MSLATRCPACSTVFRVVQDQLRVSEGWVRCGQCQEVFNALETLFDLAPSAAPEPPVEAPVEAPIAGPVEGPVGKVPTGSAPQAAAADAPSPAFAATRPAGDESAAMPTAEELGEWIEGPRPEDHWDPDEATLPMSLEALAASYRAGQATTDAPPPIPPAPPSVVTPPPRPAASAQGEARAPRGVPAAPAAPVIPAAAVAAAGSDMRVRHAGAAQADAADEDADDTQDAPTPSRFIGPVPDWARSPANERRSKKKARRIAAEAAHAQPHHGDKAQRRRRKPEFVRQAERAALWRRPMVRATLGGAAALLAALLLAQIGYQYREPLAARSPLLAPALHAGCAWLGCRIGAPRALERIRLDASDLTRTDEDQVLRFTADLHNTADFAVRAPALDLSFTDASGQVVSRKVLLPAELGARGQALGAEGQWRVDARLAVGDLRIAGYTVEVFYP